MKIIVALCDYSYALWLIVASRLYATPADTLDRYKRTVILIPGVYENWYYFRKLRAALIDEGFNVVHFDTMHKSISIQKDATQLEAYLTHKDLKDVTLIGHSSGGITALKTLSISNRVSQVIAIASPFSGVKNGHFLRTTLVRELLPNSKEIRFVSNTSLALRKKVTTIYPAYDNQVWSRLGSKLNGASNIKIAAKGHHLILRSEELSETILYITNQ